MVLFSVKKFSSERIQPAENAGNIPNLESFPNLEEPSLLKLALNKYLSL
jgi:hypothetical protein